ncbi:Fe-S cluster assembly ATPase SufC [Peptoniphilus sp. KCTC 25270]|uniref:Fe-S cluster assembly ATPase SufC n=1 Tax=Peptoniphilus sp. KCTC 25270 TaxID=2897414 RepID=UPI001E362A8D|nr:Fe-S cluster assembly ATPase SufC [Peptoniphilus sp. KCTC 25270]MCD1147778.1 Fe-S cluster assembly ATPase SufC [Peptoniphilus sp. KCTC 25270]
MENKSLLKIENVKASVGEKQILRGINLDIGPGEVHVIMGPNGSGKSTLANIIMANPVYTLDEGKIIFDGEDITDLSTDKRALKGLFMSFQTPQEVAGISVENFIRQGRLARGEKSSLIKFRKEVDGKMDLLQMKPEYKERYLNVGFSGGEKKKTEILQMLMLNPKLAILDETDSGLDVDAVRTVSKGLKEYLNGENSAIIITHHREILKEIQPDYVHVIYNGKIVVEGDDSLVDRIEVEGFNWVKEEASANE